MRLAKHFSKNNTSPAQTPVAPGDYGIISYSQEGEDMVLRRFLNRDSGFYVDIGAHHPERFSNTLYYYKHGWRGLNVDADPDLMEDFKTARPEDINVTSAVGDSIQKLTFYVFNERAINTFDQKLAYERAKVKGWRVIAKREIPILPLERILDDHIPKNQKIDFMTIDVEGQDLEVLKSNNWKNYRPDFLLIECYDIPDLSNMKANIIIDYLKAQGYVPVAKTLLSVIFANTKTYGKK